MLAVYLSYLVLSHNRLVFAQVLAYIMTNAVGLLLHLLTQLMDKTEEIR